MYDHRILPSLWGGQFWSLPRFYAAQSRRMDIIGSWPRHFVPLK
jgi:hypothetical protein